MKKIISIILVIVLCLSIFSACEPAKPPLTPEEEKEIAISAVVDKINNDKNFRSYTIYQDTETQLFTIIEISDFYEDKNRYFTYESDTSFKYRTKPVGFGDTVDQNGTRRFSSLQAILDLGLFSVKVENGSVDNDVLANGSLYNYTWFESIDEFFGIAPYEKWKDSMDHTLLSSDVLILNNKEPFKNGTVLFQIFTQIGKIPDFDLAEVGYTKRSRTFNELTEADIDTEKVTIIPDPNK